MNHIKNIAKELHNLGLDAMLVTSEPGEFYAMGFHGEGVAFITPQECWYYTDSRYIEAANQEITGAHVDVLRSGQSYRQLVMSLVATHNVKKLGFEDEGMNVHQYKLWQEALPGVELVPASDLLTRLRMVKDEEELAVMRQAQRITDEAFTEILNYVKPGVTESEIAARLTYIMASKGAQRNSFDPIVASGANGSKPHAVPGLAVIEKGQFVTMDFGCVVGGYCSDMTRTVALGEPTEEMRKVYDVVLQAQLAGLAASKAGVTGKSIDAAARKVIEDAGYGEYFGHGYGHSVGIEIHEAPNANMRDETPMPVGAAVSAEPGIYLPGRFGVRIEDVAIMTEDGCIDITKAPKELIVL